MKKTVVVYFASCEHSDGALVLPITLRESPREAHLDLVTHLVRSENLRYVRPGHEYCRFPSIRSRVFEYDDQTL